MASGMMRAGGPERRTFWRGTMTGELNCSGKVYRWRHFPLQTPTLALPAGCRDLSQPIIFTIIFHYHFIHEWGKIKGEL